VHAVDELGCIREFSEVDYIREGVPITWTFYLEDGRFDIELLSQCRNP
jgi:hypothetical protein